MNKYVLIKDYNPAYLHWIRSYLKKSRILGDREYSFREVQEILIDQNARGAQSEFLRNYFWFWRDHPELPPAYFDLFSKSIPRMIRDGEPDVKLLAAMDVEARNRNGRILFDVQDVANDFFNFYRDFLVTPLNQEIEKGAEGRTLVRFFESDELGKIPDTRIYGDNNVEEAERKLAVELLRHLKKMTLNGFLDDIVIVLERYYDRKVGRSGTVDDAHHSGAVHLSVNKSHVSGEGLAIPSISPARGYRALRKGHEGVYFPTYYVQKSSF